MKHIRHIGDIGSIKNIKREIRELKNVNVHKKRISDRNTFWLFILLLILLAHYYLYRTVGVRLGGLLEAVWLVIGFFAILSSVAVRRLEPPRRARKRMTLQSAIYRFGACWNIFVVLTTLFMLVSRPLRLPVLWEFAVSCVVALALCTYGVYEARTIRSTKFTLESDKVMGETLRIVQITDLHISPYMILAHVKRVVDAVLAAKPDIVVITGDLVDGIVGDGEGVAPFYRLFARQLKRLGRGSEWRPALGVWAVPGNHDYYQGFGNSCDFMELAHIALLSGEKRDLGPLMLLGADDLDHLKRSEENPDLSKSEALVASLSDHEARKFVLLLRHRPVVEPNTVGQFDLQLSGHTHGGQFVTIPSSMHRIPGKPKGLLSLGKSSSLYVSNGAGFVGPPMRFLAPAEIVVIDLVPGGLEGQG